MAKASTPTTEATPEALQGAALTAATELANLASEVHTSITVKGLEHVNATINLVLKLQPMLNGELTACKRANPTTDVGAGRFHKWMTDLMARGDGLTWQLDANLTFLSASFKRDARAWTSYQNRISKVTGKSPSLVQFVEHQRRFKLGHYNSAGVLTDAGKQYDAEQAEEQFKRSTGKINKWRTFDWSNFYDKDTTKEEKLTIFHELAYFFNAEALILERDLSKSTSGKEIVNKVQKAVKASIK